MKKEISTNNFIKKLTSVLAITSFCVGAITFTNETWGMNGNLSWAQQIRNPQPKKDSPKAATKPVSQPNITSVKFSIPKSRRGVYDIVKAADEQEEAIKTLKSHAEKHFMPHTEATARKSMTFSGELTTVFYPAKTVQAILQGHRFEDNEVSGYTCYRYDKPQTMQYRIKLSELCQDATKKNNILPIKLLQVCTDGVYNVTSVNSEAIDLDVSFNGIGVSAATWGFSPQQAKKCGNLEKTTISKITDTINATNTTTPFFLPRDKTSEWKAYRAVNVEQLFQDVIEAMGTSNKGYLKQHIKNKQDWSIEYEINITDLYKDMQTPFPGTTLAHFFLTANKSIRNYSTNLDKIKDKCCIKLAINFTNDEINKQEGKKFPGTMYITNRKATSWIPPTENPEEEWNILH